jgi:hypothetical protein
VIYSNVIGGSAVTQPSFSNVLGGEAHTVFQDAHFFAPEWIQSGQQATFTVVDYDDPISFATIGGVNVSATINQSGNQVTVDVPDMFDVGLERKAQPVVLGDGTDQYQQNVLLIPPDGWLYVVLSGYDTLAEDAESMADDSVLTLTDGDWLYYHDPGGILTVDGDGVASMDANLSPQTFQRIAYFPGDINGIDGVYSEMGDYVISEEGDIIVPQEYFGTASLSASPAVAGLAAWGIERVFTGVVARSLSPASVGGLVSSDIPVPFETRTTTIGSTTARARWTVPQ